MKNIKVYVKDDVTPLEYKGDKVRPITDNYGRKSGFIEIVTEHEQSNPAGYDFWGRRNPDWKSWTYEQVALIKTELVDRIEIK
jgi:hypothetical protein